MNISINKRCSTYLILTTLIIILLYSFLISTSNFYQSIRLKALDFLFSIQRAFSPPLHQLDRFAIITIDDATLKAVSMRWPWERRFFSEIIRKLDSFNSEIIYLNFTLSGETKSGTDDLFLSQAMIEAKNIIMPSYYDSNMELVSPLEIFSSSAEKVGFVNKVNDVDGVVRRFHPYHEDEGGSIDNYAVELCIYSSLGNTSEADVIPKIPLLKDGSTYINYLARPEDFGGYSLIDIFTNKAEPGFLKGKVILLGSTSEITHDIYQTPLGNMSGIYIVANTLATIMSGRYLVDLNPLLVFIILPLLTGFLIFKYGIGKGTLVVISASFLTFTFSFILFRHGFILDWFSTIFIIVINSVAVAFYRYIVILKINMKELERANVEIKNAQKEIVRREQLSTIGKLTSKIIHEISNPLVVITDHLEMLKERIKDTDEVKEILNSAHQEVLRAKRISEDLKVSYTPHVEEKIDTEINNLLLDIVRLSRKGIESNGIILELNLSEKLPLVPVSPDKIKQVFLNMILNAIDATESGKHISISTKSIKDESGEDWVDIIFRDEGCGIPEEELDRIFDAFYTTKKHKKGCGLGLFISDEIIRAHKGRISVESKVGAGTKFTIRLPVKE